MISQEKMIAVGAIWVVGFAFLSFANPQSVCNVFRQEPTSKGLRRIRLIGAIGLGIAFLSLVVAFIFGFSK